MRVMHGKMDVHTSICHKQLTSPWSPRSFESMPHVSRQHDASATGFAPAGIVLPVRGMTQLAALVLVLITLLITSGGAG